MKYVDRLLAGESLNGGVQEFYWLWIGATTTFGVGDIVTTLTMLTYDVGFREANPLARLVFEWYGAGGIVGLKLAGFFVALAVSLAAVEFWKDRLLYYFPPLVLTGIGIVVTGHNLVLLL